MLYSINRRLELELYPQRLLERDRPKPFLQQVDEIAIFTRREILPGSGLALTLSLQTDGEALALCTGRVADLPIIALLTTLGEILAAETLGTVCQSGREVCDAGCQHE